MISRQVPKQLKPEEFNTLTKSMIKINVDIQPEPEPVKSPLEEPKSEDGLSRSEVRRKKALGSRKEPEEEFFYMSLVSQIMTNA